LSIGAAGVGATLAGINRLLRLRTEQKVDAEETDAHSPSIRIAKKAEATVAQTVKNILSGANATRLRHLPWFPTAAAGAITAGGLLGYKGTDALLSKMRDAAAKAEIARAQQEYEDAMFGERPGLKLAGEKSQLARSFSKIVPVMQKLSADTSILKPEAERVASAMVGLYAMLAAGGTAAGAYHGFKSQRSKSDTAAVRRAQKERQLVEARPVSHVPVVVGSPITR
jgi:hypothetical protein